MIPRERVFEIWAPPAGRWSEWVKPILFAHMPAMLEDLEMAPVPAGAAPVDPAGASAAAARALVVDLPGARALDEWVGLARRGYRPVPLYNAAPGPKRASGFGPAPVPQAPGPEAAAAPGLMAAGLALIDVWPIVEALIEKTALLQALALPPAAPPAFLLDARRRLGPGPPSPGAFDNRSICFPTDFPSASFLLGHGIREAVVIQEALSEPQPDLAHTLRRWQEGGIRLALQMAGQEGPPLPFEARAPSRFKSLAYGLLARLGLRQNPLGGFGGLVPHPSSG